MRDAVQRVVECLAALLTIPDRVRWLEREARDHGREIDELTARVEEFDVAGKTVRR